MNGLSDKVREVMQFSMTEHVPCRQYRIDVFDSKTLMGVDIVTMVSVDRRFKEYKQARSEALEVLSDALVADGIEIDDLVEIPSY